MDKKRTIHIALPCIGEEEKKAILEPLETGWLTQGPKVQQFEQDFAQRHGVKHAFAVTSCTTALHLALVALGVGPGDEVIVPSFTWVATANAAIYCGATPILADIELESFNIDPQEIAKKITSKTKAIIAVHLFGLCADIKAIRAVAPGIPVVEDGACAAGCAHNGVSAGALGDIGTFSFHPRKSITTGEGGMVTTNNSEIAKKLDMLRNHGAAISEEVRHQGAKPYLLPDFPVVGYNYRMTDLQGAIGVEQLKKLDRFIDEREVWATFYNKEFSDIDWLQTPKITSEFKRGWQSYVLLVDEQKSPKPRNQIMEELKEMGIATRPGTHAVHTLKVYQEMYGFKNEDFPNSYQAAEQSLAIPLHNKMTVEDYEYIVQAIKKIGR